jgi:hypothetical protein
VNAFDSKFAKPDRVIHRFKIPDSIAGEVRELGLVELTAEDELMVESRCRGSSDKRAHEMAKQSIAEVNGKAVSLADGSTDKLWSSMHPKVRVLVASAWVKLHLASDEELESFFASRTSGI